ncbi:MAG: sensor histidine kinase [Chloroflexota bacterium]
MMFDSGQALILKIEDDGVGFDPANVQNGGMGLETMHERSESLSAQVHVESRPGAGTIIAVEMKIRARTFVSSSSTITLSFVKDSSPCGKPKPTCK